MVSAAPAIHAVEVDAGPSPDPAVLTLLRFVKLLHLSLRLLEAAPSLHWPFARSKIDATRATAFSKLSPWSANSSRRSLSEDSMMLSSIASSISTAIHVTSFPGHNGNPFGKCLAAIRRIFFLYLAM